MKTPVKAIRAHCIECSDYNAAEVKQCPITNCELYPYRMGRNPSRKGLGGSVVKKKANVSKS